MKIVDIPAPARVKVPTMKDGRIADEEREIPFVKFLGEACDGFAAFKSGPKQARTYDKIMDRLEAVDGEKTVAFEDEHFEVLKSAVEAAQWLTPAINRAYLKAGFYDAMEKAEGIKK